MWESMLVWRRENRADSIHEWFVFHERAEYDKLYPTGLHRTDKEVRCTGRAIQQQRYGRIGQ